MDEWRCQAIRLSHHFRVGNPKSESFRGVQPVAFSTATQQSSLRERLEVGGRSREKLI
ncbi:MAG: hypothetical protein AB7H80_11450 [Candidatus Kapaibacterium sp.]